MPAGEVALIEPAGEMWSVVTESPKMPSGRALRMSPVTVLPPSKKGGDWMVSYDYRSVGANAVIASIDSADSLNAAGINGKVHRAKASYMLADNMTVDLAGFLGTKTAVTTGAVGTRYNKAQLNVTLAF